MKQCPLPVLHPLLVLRPLPVLRLLPVLRPLPVLRSLLFPHFLARLCRRMRQRLSKQNQSSRKACRSR